MAIRNPFKRGTGPEYSADVVERDVWNKLDIGDTFGKTKRRVVETTFDATRNKYIVVSTREEK